MRANDKRRERSNIWSQKHFCCKIVWVWYSSVVTKFYGILFLLSCHRVLGKIGVVSAFKQIRTKCLDGVECGSFFRPIGGAMVPYKMVNWLCARTAIIGLMMFLYEFNTKNEIRLIFINNSLKTYEFLNCSTVSLPGCVINSECSMNQNCKTLVWLTPGIVWYCFVCCGTAILWLFTELRERKC